MWLILRRTFYGLMALVLLAIIVIYVWSSVLLKQSYTAVKRDIELSSDTKVIAEGGRKAQIFGCYHGCHGADMQGEVFFDEPFVGYQIAPSLTMASHKYSPAQMEAIVRQGIRPDGSGVVSMPSSSFATMTDEDITAILSFIHQYPRQTSELEGSRFGLLSRALVIAGWIPVATSKEDGSPWKVGDLDEPLKQGEYLVMNACSECHGLELEGSPGFSPPLIIAKAYNREQFHALLEEGSALAERDLGLMGLVIKYRFSQLESSEVDAIYDFLQSR